MKNELAGDLSLAESKNQYDDKVKRVLSNKIILAWILKYVTEEFTDMSVDEIKSCISSDIEVSEIGVAPGWTNWREMEKIRGEASNREESRSYCSLWRKSLPEELLFLRSQRPWKRQKRPSGNW